MTEASFFSARIAAIRIHGSSSSDSVCSHHGTGESGDVKLSYIASQLLIEMITIVWESREKWRGGGGGGEGVGG